MKPTKFFLIYNTARQMSGASILQSSLGMHRISGRRDIRPDNPAFFKIWYPAGYRILQIAGHPAGYPANL
jgi:hypothetical protein